MSMFVTVEGIDGSGKTSVLARLGDLARAEGFPLCLTREPGDSSLGQGIREIVLAQGKTVDARAELFLFLADRAQHVSTVIRPSLQRGMLVLCDRYSDSTRAYQGGAFETELLETLIVASSGGLEPDLTVLLDLDVQTALARIAGRKAAGNEETRFDAYDISYHQAVRDRYLGLADRFPDRFFLVDAAQSPEAVVAQVWETVARRYRAGGQCLQK